MRRACLLAITRRIVRDMLSAIAPRKLVVFSQFTTMLDILEGAGSVAGWSWRRLDGSTPVKERLAIVDEFQQDAGIQLFLVSTKAGGVGLTLTAAHHAVILDPGASCRALAHGCSSQRWPAQLRRFQPDERRPV